MHDLATIVAMNQPGFKYQPTVPVTTREMRHPKTEEERIIQGLTQALKDLINGDYTQEQIEEIFGEDYSNGYAYLEKHGIAEIA